MSAIEVQTKGSSTLIELAGRLDAVCVGERWSAVLGPLQRIQPDKITVDASGLSDLDGAGIAFLLQLQRLQAESKKSFEIVHLDPAFQKLLQDSTIEGLATAPLRKPSFRHVAEEVGQTACRVWEDAKQMISFLGELAFKLAGSLLRPYQIRWRDFWFLTEKAGADAINITSLLGFLIGVILAFQMAVLMAQFAAESYVADAMVLVMFREMGPLISAFVLASRSGSAYAAEIGTMKVSEELDAMRTFGMDPVRFLVMPRVLAMVTALPLLTLFNILFALFGAQVVMAMVGISPVVFWDRCRQAADLVDLFSGLIKTCVFGYFIAAIGCLRGLYTGKGASAVGDSATSAVVTCIVMIVVVDGVFAVIYYALGI